MYSFEFFVLKCGKLALMPGAIFTPKQQKFNN